MKKPPVARWSQSRRKWEAHGISPAGGRRTFRGDTKLEAETLALESYGERAPSTTTFYGFYLNVYLPTIAHRSANWRGQIVWAIEKHVAPIFAAWSLDRITRAEAQRFFNQLAASGLSGESIKRIKIVFSGVMRLAEQDDAISRNPVESVRLPRSTAKAKTVLTFDQLSLLIWTAPDLLRAPLILMACGLRCGEACGVRADSIRDGILHVERQVLQVDGGTELTETLKTPASHRQIPLPASLAVALRSCNQVSSIWIASNLSGGFLLPNRVGLLLQQQIEKIRKDDETFPRVTPHEIRHTFVSLMENELEAPRAICERLAGHAQKGVHARYSHSDLKQLRRWMERYWERIEQAREIGEERQA